MIKLHSNCALRKRMHQHLQKSFIKMCLHTTLLLLTAVTYASKYVILSVSDFANYKEPKHLI